MRIHHHLLLYVLLFVSYYFSCTESLSRTDFPAGFIFGGGSSAYQVYITLIYRLNYAFYIHYVYLILMLFLGFVLISIQSMKGLHINMEKGLAYGTLSLGYIQVSHSHHSSFFMNKLVYSIKGFYCLQSFPFICNLIGCFLAKKMDYSIVHTIRGIGLKLYMIFLSFFLSFFFFSEKDRYLGKKRKNTTDVTSFFFN